MNSGDSYWVDLNPTQGSLRPCVLIGATPINQARQTVVVIPLSTSAKARPSLTISVLCKDKYVSAICDQIRTADKSRFKGIIGTLSGKDLCALEDGLRQVLSL